MSTAIAEAVRDGRLPGRVWLYSNYHCNLVCTYCLTDSSPKSPRRDLAADRMVDLAVQARALGFTDLGVTGGEPFLRPDMVDVLLAMAEQLPTVVLSNATLFHGDRLTRVEALAASPLSFRCRSTTPTPTTTTPNGATTTTPPWSPPSPDWWSGASGSASGPPSTLMSR